MADAEGNKLWVSVLGFVIPSSIVTNLVSLICIQLKLKINGYIATILTLDTVFKALLMATSMFGYYVVEVEGYRNLQTCSLYLLPALAAYLTCYIFSSATSIIRYHMASRVSNQRMFQRWFIVLVIAMALVLELSLIASMAITVFYFNASFSPVIDACYNNEIHIVSGSFVSLGIGVTCLSVGIFYDVAMYRFLKKRYGQVNNMVAMVAWKQPPNDQGQDQQEAVSENQQQAPFISWGAKDYTSKATIPIKATLLGMVNLVILLVLIYIFANGFGYPTWTSFFLQTTAMVSVTLHMPFVLLFAIKSNEKTSAKLNVSPPEGLQFHE